VRGAASPLAARALVAQHDAAWNAQDARAIVALYTDDVRERMD
jgi:ketosteroid isomerase-like protein